MSKFGENVLCGVLIPIVASIALVNAAKEARQKTRRDKRTAKGIYDTEEMNAALSELQIEN